PATAALGAACLTRRNHYGLRAPRPIRLAWCIPASTSSHVRPLVSLTIQIRRLARHSAIYGLGGILSRLLAVLLLPLYTSYLGTAGFGKIEQITALTTVLVIV